MLLSCMEQAVPESSNHSNSIFEQDNDLLHTLDFLKQEANTTAPKKKNDISLVSRKKRNFFSSG